MKKSIMIIGWLLILFLFNCVGSDSLEKIRQDFSTATEDVVSKVAKAEENADRDEVATALKDYSGKIKQLVARLKALKKANEKSGQDPDVDLDQARKDFQKIAGDFGNLIKQLAGYLNDAEIMDVFRGASKDISEFFK